MNPTRLAAVALAITGLCTPAWALDFTMNFDNIPVAMAPPPPPSQGFGSAVLGYYDNDPVYNRAGAQAWDTTFSSNALAIGSLQDPNGQGNFATAHSGFSAVGMVVGSSFDLVVTDGLYVSALSLWYNVQPGSSTSLQLFSAGANVFSHALSECSVGGADGFCGWTQYVVPESALAGALITRAAFSGLPNTAVFDDIAMTTTPVPEPSTYAFMLLGLSALATLRRRRAR